MPSSSGFPPAIPVISVAHPVSEGGRRLLDLLLKSGGMSQAELTRTLDLSQPTVARLLQGFQRDGLVRSTAKLTEPSGHRSALVGLNPDFAGAFGIYLAADAVSMSLMDFSGAVRAMRRAAMPDMTRRVVIDTLDRFKGELIAESGFDPQRVIGAGAGISAFHIAASGQFNPPSYLDDWALMRIEPILAEALGYPVMVENDGTVAAIGESLFGVGRRCGNFAYLHLTNGFGGGVVVEGQPLRGQHGNAGEFGAVWALTGSDYINLDLLRQCLRDHGKNFDSVEAMIGVIAPDWPGVKAWLDRAEPSISLLSGILAACIDPALIVIGGRLPTTIAQALAARIRIPIATDRRGHPLPLPAVVAAEAPDDPVSLGAAAMPLRKAFFAHR